MTRSLVDDDERPGRVHVLGGEGMALEPAVELVVAGREPGKVVVFAEPLEPQVLAVHASGIFGVALEQLDEFGDDLGRLVELGQEPVEGLVR